MSCMQGYSSNVLCSTWPQIWNLNHHSHESTIDEPFMNGASEEMKYDNVRHGQFNDEFHWSSYILSRYALKFICLH